MRLMRWDETAVMAALWLLAGFPGLSERLGVLAQDEAEEAPAESEKTPFELWEQAEEKLGQGAGYHFVVKCRSQLPGSLWPVEWSGRGTMTNPDVVHMTVEGFGGFFVELYQKGERVVVREHEADRWRLVAFEEEGKIPGLEKAAAWVKEVGAEVKFAGPGQVYSGRACHVLVVEVPVEQARAWWKLPGEEGSSEGEKVDWENARLRVLGWIDKEEERFYRIRVTFEYVPLEEVSPLDELIKKARRELGFSEEARDEVREESGDGREPESKGLWGHEVDIQIETYRNIIRLRLPRQVKVLLEED